MIGKLINEFDNLEKPTLKTFNKMFITDLKGPEDAEVIIGRMNVGGIRELLIDGNKVSIRIPDRQNTVSAHGRTRQEGAGRPSPYTYTLTKDGVSKKLNTLGEVAKEIEKGYSYVYFMITKKKEFNGWTVTKDLK